MSVAEIPLAARGVSFAYPGGPTVLEEISLEASAGQLTALIGCNGSGKTTLLRLLAGTLSPARGAVTLDGRPLRELGRREVARHLAHVPQVRPVDFPFIVQEVVLQGRHPFLGLLAPERADDLALAREAMEALDILPLAGRSILTLSAGQRQLVDVAAALTQTPRVLLLDEPAASLDPRHVRTLYRQLRARCARRGVAAVVVTHDLNQAAAYADRVVALGATRVVAEGPPREVLQAPILEQVYGLELHVGQAPVSGRPFVLLDP